MCVCVCVIACIICLCVSVLIFSVDHVRFLIHAHNTCVRVFRAGQTPGPGAHEVDSFVDKITGGRFSTAKPKRWCRDTVLMWSYGMSGGGCKCVCVYVCACVCVWT